MHTKNIQLLFNHTARTVKGNITQVHGPKPNGEIKGKTACATAMPREAPNDASDSDASDKEAADKEAVIFAEAMETLLAHEASKNKQCKPSPPELKHMKCVKPNAQMAEPFNQWRKHQERQNQPDSNLWPLGKICCKRKRPCSVASFALHATQ